MPLLIVDGLKLLFNDLPLLFETLISCLKFFQLFFCFLRCGLFPVAVRAFLNIWAQISVLEWYGIFLNLLSFR